MTPTKKKSKNIEFVAQVGNVNVNQDGLTSVTLKIADKDFEISSQLMKAKIPNMALKINAMAIYIPPKEKEDAKKKQPSKKPTRRVKRYPYRK